MTFISKNTLFLLECCYALNQPTIDPTYNHLKFISIFDRNIDFYFRNNSMTNENSERWLGIA